MDIQDLTQLGVPGVCLGAIVIIVKYFISFIKLQEKNSNKIVTNHINHSNKIMIDLNKSNDRVATMVERLIIFLKQKKK